MQPLNLLSQRKKHDRKDTGGTKRCLLFKWRKLSWQEDVAEHVVYVLEVEALLMAHLELMRIS